MGFNIHYLIQTSQQVNEIGTVSTFLQIGKLRFKQKWLTFELFTLCQALCFTYNISREPHNSPESGAADILIEPTGNDRSEVRSISNSPVVNKGHLILAKRLRSDANKEQNGT